MNWNSWSDFIHMGGYGPYVWGSLGTMVIAMSIEVWRIAVRSHMLHRMGAGIDDSEASDEVED